RRQSHAAFGPTTGCEKLVERFAPANYTTGTSRLPANRVSMRPHCTQHLRRRHHAFTLIELLVVIGIMAVLIGILMPVLAGARRSARMAACAANLRQIGQALEIYQLENHQNYPYAAFEYVNGDINNEITFAEFPAASNWQGSALRSSCAGPDQQAMFMPRGKTLHRTKWNYLFADNHVAAHEARETVDPRFTGALQQVMQSMATVTQDQNQPAMLP